MRHTHSQRGFTLIEAILAVSIIVTGLVALLTLARLSIIAADATVNRIRAVAYAQEAMEVVRNIRDTNWLEYDTDSTTVWNDGLFSPTDPTDYSAVITTTLAQPLTGHALDFRPDTRADTCDGASCTRLWEDPVQRFVMQSAETDADMFAAGVFKTEYTRIVLLYPICRSRADIQDEYIEHAEGVVCAALTHNQVGIDVVVRVEYPGRSQRNEMIIEEKMYDWRY